MVDVRVRAEGHTREDVPSSGRLLPRRGRDAPSRQVRRAAPRHRAALRRQPRQARAPKDLAGPEIIRHNHPRGGVRWIMAEEGLVAWRIGKRMRCSSCGGRIAETQPIIFAGEFGAPAPAIR